MSADIELKWEWPADRAIEDRMLVKIESIKKQGGVFFGLKNSASMVDSLPDPMVISGMIMTDGSKLKGKKIQLVVPKMELKDIIKGAFVMLGIVENSICICIVPVESSVDLKSVNCT